MLHAEQKEKDNSIEDSNKKKVLVGGGTGFIGTELCKSLKRKGYLPVIVSRNPGEAKITYKELEKKGIPKNTKAIVNLAGENVLNFFKSWDILFKGEVYNSRIHTAMAFRDAIRESAPENRPEVFVQITGIGYFPPRNDDFIYDEDTQLQLAPKDRDWFSLLVEDWEAAAYLSPSYGVRNVFIRPGVVLGRNGGMIQQIFLPFYFGGGGRMGSGTQNMPWIHVKDLSGIIVHAIENEKVEGVLNGVAPEIITNQEFVKSFASALNRPSFFPLPDFVWNTVFGEERATMITKGQKVTPKRTLESGYQYRFPTISQACGEFSKLFYEDSDGEK